MTPMRLMKNTYNPINSSVATFEDDPKDTICCWPASTSSQPVPSWMLQKTLFGRTTSVALFLGIMNTIAMCLHLFMAIWVFVLAVSADEATGESKGSIMLPAYRTRIVTLFTESNTDSMHSPPPPPPLPPSESAPAWDPTQLKPQYVITPTSEIVWFNLTAITIGFFMLSFLGHFIVFVTSVNTNIYMWWIARCRNPLRWIEYTLSAALMSIPIAYVCGIRSAELLWAIFALVLITMPFGWVTEALSRPIEIAETATNVEGIQITNKNILRCETWQIGSKESTLVLGARWTAPLQRLGPWLLGWIPYGFAWGLVLSQYFYSIDMIKNEDFKPPDWVGALLVAEVVVFSCFAVVQFAQQVSNAGCYYYWWGELSYIILSLTAKMILGITLVLNIMQIPNQQQVLAKIEEYNL